METYTGNRGLRIEEPLIFEQDSPGRTGVDLSDVPDVEDRLGGLSRTEWRAKNDMRLVQHCGVKWLILKFCILIEERERVIVS